MTRINVGIPVERLPDKLLLAEHREIKRIPNHLKKHGNPKNVPNVFKLGTGHVVFLITKGKYTYSRYIELYNECIKRGFKVQDYRENWNIYKDYPNLNNDYLPSENDIEIIKERISDRGFDLL